MKGLPKITSARCAVAVSGPRPVQGKQVRDLRKMQRQTERTSTKITSVWQCVVCAQFRAGQIKNRKRHLWQCIVTKPDLGVKPDRKNRIRSCQNLPKSGFLCTCPEKPSKFRFFRTAFYSVIGDRAPKDFLFVVVECLYS